MFNRTFLLLSFLVVSTIINHAFAEEQVFKEDNKVVFTVGPDEKVSVEDGDTFWIGIHEIRLIGIDTIEDGQNCLFEGETNFCDLKTKNEL